MSFFWPVFAIVKTITYIWQDEKAISGSDSQSEQCILLMFLSEAFAFESYFFLRVNHSLST
jgi:hypothetical protein